MKTMFLIGSICQLYNHRQCEDFEIVKTLGSGKYSNVYLGKKNDDDSDIVIKILKPVRDDKIKREIKILNALKGSDYIVELLGCYGNPQAQSQSLV